MAYLGNPPDIGRYIKLDDVGSSLMEAQLRLLLLPGVIQ